MENIVKNMAQIANDLENKIDLHEYCNAESVKIKIGNFESFDDFVSYFRHHYAPVLKKVSSGEALTVEESRLLGWFAGEMLDTFKEEPDSDDGDGLKENSVIVVSFSDSENFKKAQQLFDSEGPSRFWAADWDESARTIEFAECNSADILEQALRQEMTAANIEGFSFCSHINRV